MTPTQLLTPEQVAEIRKRAEAVFWAVSPEHIVREIPALCATAEELRRMLEETIGHCELAQSKWEAWMLSYKDSQKQLAASRSDLERAQAKIEELNEKIFHGKMAGLV